MHPDQIWNEQLITSVDVASNGATAWVVRRPAQDGKTYTHDLWWKSRGRSPELIMELPDIAGPLRLGHTGDYSLIVSQAATGRVVIRVEIGSSTCSVIPHTQGACQVEINPVDGRIAMLRDLSTPTAPDLTAVELQFSTSSGGLDDPMAGCRQGSKLAVIDGDVSRTVEMPERLKISAVGWDSDGTALWFTVSRSDQQGPHELWTANADELVARFHTNAPGEIHAVAWSTEHGVVFAAGDTTSWAGQPGLYLTSIDASGYRRIDDDQYIGQATLSDLLHTVDPEHSTLAWRSDGSLLFIATQDGSPRLLRWRDSTITAVHPPGIHVAAIRSNGHHAAAIARTAERSSDVWLLGSDLELQRVSEHGGWLPTPCWPQIEPVISREHTGQQIINWIFHNGDSTSAKPMLVHLHGGPYSAHGPLPWMEICLLVSAGFDILCPNPPGSTSFGDAYSTALLGNWGTVDVDYVNRCVDQTLALGFGAAGWLGVMGMSYGGYLTAQLLAKTDRFRAGIIENGPTNLVSLVGTTDIPGSPTQQLVGAKTFDQLWAMSPLRAAGAISAPVLLLIAEADVRVPPTEMHQLQQTLRRNGGAVEVVQYPAEGHLMYLDGRPDRRAHRLALITRWLRVQAQLEGDDTIIGTEMSA